MKYLKKIRIKGYEYDISYVPTGEEVSRNFSTSLLGQCTSSPKNSSIRIFSDQTKIGILETLIHETLHALFYRNPLLAKYVNDEESFIETLALEIAIILIENKLVNLPKKPPITRRYLEK